MLFLRINNGVHKLFSRNDELTSEDWIISNSLLPIIYSVEKTIGSLFTKLGGTSIVALFKSLFNLITKLLSAREIFSTVYGHADVNYERMSGGRQMAGHFLTNTIDENNDWIDQTKQKNP